MRIDKILEEKGFGSRKTVKRLIQRKVVLVDGEAVTNGSFNVEGRLHQVTVQGAPISGFPHQYVMLNKPAGVVTALTDATCETVLDLINDRDKTEGLYPVGRLDRDTEGLLLLTDNGQLGYQLLIPDKKVSKVYEVTTKEPLETTDIAAFAAGIVFIGGEMCKPATRNSGCASRPFKRVRRKIPPSEKDVFSSWKKSCSFETDSDGAIRVG